jgi:enediyne biosynthesis protein E4
MGTGLGFPERPWRRALLLAIIAGAGIWGGWRWWEVRGARRAMAAIEGEIEHNRYGTAARQLLALLARQPDSGEARYLLGTCELARGRTDTADEAWARVPPGSPFAVRAILGRMQLRMERGRYADAEQIVRDALDDPRIDGSSLLALLGAVYSEQGRLDETLRLIETRWDGLNRSGEGASEPAIKLARSHVALRRSSAPAEGLRWGLDRAAALAPDDDRVWLAKANLAIRAGSYEEAARWLDACLKRHPEDVPVWRARLTWAVATSRIAEAREAMTHLPAAESTPTQIQRLAAWLAARRGDREAERRAVERLVAVDPTDFAAFDRLAELADRDGQADRAAGLRREKAEVAQLVARYGEVHQRNQPIRDAAEIARLARRLGQDFEVRAFLMLAAAVDPRNEGLQRELAALGPPAPAMGDTGRALADVLADELDASLRSASSMATPAAPTP